MRTSGAWFLLTAGMAVGTVLAGWLAVPGLALTWGALTRRRPHADWLAALAAASAWAALLAWGAPAGASGVLAGRVGGVLGLPAWGVVVATLLFGTLLALAGAALTRRVP